MPSETTTCIFCSISPLSRSDIHRPPCQFRSTIISLHAHCVTFKCYLGITYASLFFLKNSREMNWAVVFLELFLCVHHCDKLYNFPMASGIALCCHNNNQVSRYFLLFFLGGEGWTASSSLGFSGEK